MENSFEEKEINLRQIINDYLQYKFWFLFSVIISVLIVSLYLVYKKPVYSAVSQVIVKSKLYKNQSSESLNEAFFDFPFNINNSTAEEQMNVMKSRDLIQSLVIENGLFLTNDFATSDNAIKNGTIIKLNTNDYKEYIYKKKLHIPFLLKQPIDYSNDEKYNYLYLNNVDGKKSTHLISIASDSLDKDLINRSVDAMLSKLAVNRDGDKSSHLIKLSYSDVSREKAEFLLGKVISQYNSSTKDSLNKMTSHNIQFIEKRVSEYRRDLDNIEQHISAFKSLKNISTETQTGSIVWNSKIELENNINKTKGILNNIELIDGHLNNKENNFSLISYHANINNSVLENLITDYNKNLTKYLNEKKYLPRHEKEIIESSINDQKQRLLILLDELYQGFNNSVKLDRFLLSKYEQNVVDSENNVSKVEKIIKQKKIIEELYLYLLKKLEEEKIRTAKDVPSLSVVNSPYASSVPVSPKKQILILGAIIIGLLIPVGIIQLKTIMDNTLKNKSDLDPWYKGPFLGYIFKMKEKDKDDYSVKESIRIVLSNLEFLLPKRKDGKVVFVTSSIPNEGKTFVSFHLAKILSEQRKKDKQNTKVLLVGADLRAPKLLDHIGNIENPFSNLSEIKKIEAGLSGFLLENEDSLNEYVVENPSGLKFSFLNAGDVPPNPSELLSRSGFKKLITEAKEKFDYIIVDTAPVGILSDTVNISKFADATLFVIRSNYSDKENNEVLIDMFENNKLKNIGVVINDYEGSRNNKYYYKY